MRQYPLPARVDGLRFEVFRDKLCEEAPNGLAMHRRSSREAAGCTCRAYLAKARAGRRSTHGEGPVRNSVDEGLGL